MKKFGMFPQQQQQVQTTDKQDTVYYNGVVYEKVLAKDVLSLGLHTGVVSGVTSTGAFLNFFVEIDGVTKVASGRVHESSIVEDDLVNPYYFLKKFQRLTAEIIGFDSKGNAKITLFHLDLDNKKNENKRVATTVVQKDEQEKVEVPVKSPDAQIETEALKEQMKKMEEAQAQKLAEIQAEQAEKFAAMEKGMQQILQEKVTQVEIEASYAQKEALELKEKMKQMEAEMQRKLDERTALMEAEYQAKMKEREEAARQQAIETRVQELKSRMEKIVRVVSPKAEKFIREMLTEGYNSIEIGEAFLRTAASFDPSLQFALSMESDLRRSLRGE